MVDTVGLRDEGLGGVGLADDRVREGELVGLEVREWLVMDWV